MEPPQHDKYLLWASILAEKDERFPKKRFNGSKCKYTLISMNNTRVIEDREGRFAKDKRSERNQSILPEEATHFGDAVDNIRNHNRNAYGRTRNVRNGNRCTSGQAIGHRTARGGTLLVIFPCFLLFCLRFWIGRGRQKLPFLFPFGW